MRNYLMYDVRDMKVHEKMVLFMPTKMFYMMLLMDSEVSDLILVRYCQINEAKFGKFNNTIFNKSSPTLEIFNVMVAF